MTTPPADQTEQDEPETRVLVGVCGAANVMNLPAYLHALRALPGCRIRVVMTASAAGILPPATVRLVADEVYCDGVHNADPGHIQLARWADLFLLLPATAHLLGQAANGLAGNLVATTVLAYADAAIFFPSMNGQMWKQPSVQRNVERLRADGHQVVEPEPAECWEVASASFQQAAGLPAPRVVAQMAGVLGMLAKRSGAAERIPDGALGEGEIDAGH